MKRKCWRKKAAAFLLCLAMAASNQSMLFSAAAELGADKTEFIEEGNGEEAAAEQENGSSSAGENEPAAQTDSVIEGTDQSASQSSETEGTVSKAEETASETEGTDTETKETAAETEGTAAEAEGAVPETEGTASEAEETVSETEETASETEETDTETEETVPETTESAEEEPESDDSFDPDQDNMLKTELENLSVTADIPAGAFEAPVELKAEVIDMQSEEAGAMMNSVMEAIAAENDGAVSIAGAFAVQVSFKEIESGNEVEPNKPVEITISADPMDIAVAEDAGNLESAVFHISEGNSDGETAFSAEEVDGGEVILNDANEFTGMHFTTDSFSPFAAVVLDSPATLDEKALNELSDGVNVIKEGAENLVFEIDDGKVVMIEGTDAEPIVFRNCTFNLSGKTIKISGNQQGVSYNPGETATKLFIGKNVQFDNCVFTSQNGEYGTINKSSGKWQVAGWDACIYFFSGDIVLNNCSLTGTNYKGQFMGLYGSSGSVVFDHSTISTVGNTNGWSYAMYGASVLKLVNNSEMTATGMARGFNPDGSLAGNVNAFYSGDLKTNYDAVYIQDSTVDFSDNYGGGFAINRVNIYVDRSNITVCDNAGNASNSGVWFVTDSVIKMNGNRTHGWSHISDATVNSTVEILHNGYAGYYITADSSFSNSRVDIRCNGESYLSYSAGDVWLNTHTLALKDCDEIWLGAVGRTGSVTAEKCKSVVAYDLFENKTKGNTAPVLDGVALSGQDEHVLFLNPSKGFDYARGDTEGKAGNSNDDDLFADVAKEAVIGKETAKIGTLTEAQLSHHKYNWANGEITDNATADAYGVKKYECVDTCSEHIGWTQSHPDSFSCNGTYVYAPLVALTFDANVEENSIAAVTNMPENQTGIDYNGSAEEPKEVPAREKYVFAGWYEDQACTNAYDFSAKLTDNWTVVYAKWSIPSIDISVEKNWDDAGNEDKIRPESIEVALFADGAETGKTLILNEENAWKGSFLGLDEYAEEKEILYTVAETKIPEGYTGEVTGNKQNGFVITNTHTVERKEEKPETPDSGSDSTPGTTSTGTVVTAAPAADTAPVTLPSASEPAGSAAEGSATGDNTPVLIWLVIALAAAASLLGLGSSKMRRLRGKKRG